MAYHYVNWISIGNHPDLDPTEVGTGITNPGALSGKTWSNADTDATNNAEIVSVRLNDANGDGRIYDGEGHYEHGTYRLNGESGTSSNVDSYTQWNATVVTKDAAGNDVTSSRIVHVTQFANGDTFIGQVNNLDGLDIKSITLDSVHVDTFTHFAPDNSVDGSTLVTCFTSGTLISTQHGLLDIAQLSVGDKVITMDRGYQPIRWIGKSKVKATGNLAPIKILTGTLGHGMPTRDLRVSPQHRILMRSRIARRMFNSAEVLIPAKKLLDLPGVSVDTSEEYVTYWHILFDRHEIVYSEGAATESFYTGKQAMKSVGQEAREEIMELFPELKQAESPPVPARPIVRGMAQEILVARHKKNERHVFQPRM